MIPHRADLSPSHQRGSPDVIREYASVTHWGNIMFCLFLWMHPSRPALCTSSCHCRTWDCPQEVQGLWQGCRWCCGTGATDLVVHFHWPALWRLARFVLLSGSPCRDVFSSNNSFPLIQVFPAKTDSSSQYYRKTTTVCPYFECGRTGLIMEALNSNVKKNKSKYFEIKVEIILCSNTICN